jgi:hypothetical protein
MLLLQLLKALYVHISASINIHNMLMQNKAIAVCWLVCGDQTTLLQATCLGRPA